MNDNEEPWYKYPDENRIISIIHNANIEQALVISKVEIAKINRSLKCIITTSHIKYNTIGKIYVCYADITRYFITESVSNKRDTLKEIGYPLRLLRDKSIEEIHDILSKAKFKEAPIDKGVREVKKKVTCIK